MEFDVMEIIIRKCLKFLINIKKLLWISPQTFREKSYEMKIDLQILCEIHKDARKNERYKEGTRGSWCRYGEWGNIRCFGNVIVIFDFYPL